MRLGVLGAGGFIGSRTVEMLHLSGAADVRAIAGRAAGLALASRFALDRQVADARDQQALARAFRGCDAVLHAVAGGEDVILGTLAPTYRAAEEAGVRRLVYLGSAAVHGQAPEPGTDERSALRDDHPVPYNNAKVRAERTLAELRRGGRVEVVILRPGIVVGPRSSWIGRFADALLRDDAYLVNRGRGICNSIYVDNLVHAIALALRAPGTDGEAFLVGDAEEVTWAALYRPVAEALGVDLDGLPEAALPAAPTPWESGIETLRRSRAVRVLAATLPTPLRSRLGAAFRAPGTAAANGAWRPAPRRPPVVTTEMALLYQCRYRLPWTKAARVLGYEPIVGFPDACRRTVGWLGFAGYPVTEAAAT